MWSHFFSIYRLIYGTYVLVQLAPHPTRVCLTYHSSPIQIYFNLLPSLPLFPTRTVKSFHFACCHSRFYFSCCRRVASRLHYGSQFACTAASRACSYRTRGESRTYVQLARMACLRLGLAPLSVGGSCHKSVKDN